jgi:hypothetical protein
VSPTDQEKQTTPDDGACTVSSCAQGEDTKTNGEPRPLREYGSASPSAEGRIHSIEFIERAIEGLRRETAETGSGNSRTEERLSSIREYYGQPTGRRVPSEHWLDDEDIEAIHRDMDHWSKSDTWPTDTPAHAHERDRGGDLSVYVPDMDRGVPLTPHMFWPLNGQVERAPRPYSHEERDTLRRDSPPGSIPSRQSEPKKGRDLSKYKCAEKQRAGYASCLARFKSRQESRGCKEEEK